MKRKLSSNESSLLLEKLAVRFSKNMHRHRGIVWDKVAERLAANPEKLWSLHQMEVTGGEPDVTGYDKKTGEYLFTDCSVETPKDRRSLCYDGDALESRKTHKPAGSAIQMAKEMGIELMTEDEYMKLQESGPYDTKTSSWLKTPSAVRDLGGAIFGDHRFGRVFIYHNGAESYYGARGFRGVLRV